MSRHRNPSRMRALQQGFAYTASASQYKEVLQPVSSSADASAFIGIYL